MKKENKIIKAIKASILCIKYPFLYPRNRFDDKHHIHALGHKLYTLYQQAIQEVGISANLESNPVEFVETIVRGDLIITLNKESRKLTISNKIETKEYDLKRLLWNSDDKFEILGFKINSFYRPSILIQVKTKDETDKTNYGFFFDDIKLIRDKRKLRLYEILNWIDKKILDKILFIPTYTELDAMPQGWRKVFGLDMCKDIKRTLLKTGGRKALHNYRIDQIKEKFGSLRWYDHNSTEEIWNNVIPKYEERSFKTCIDCGKPATCISTGWVSPYCDDCKSENRQYVPINEEHAWDKALGLY